jgi:transcriptional regulator with XRE-family HTH domain
MPTKERSSDRGQRRGERLLDELLREVREARIGRNLSQAAVGRAIGLSDSQVSLIETGRHRNVPFVLVARLLGVVGLELSARAYPAGGGLRDMAQLVLLDRLRKRTSGSLAWRSEVPIPIDGDLRAWDAALVRPGLTIGVDAETRLRDVQAVDRRVMLKLRDSGFDRAVLLIASTRSNREALHEAGSSLEANYPIATRAALQALAVGEDPGGNCLIVL